MQVINKTTETSDKDRFFNILAHVRQIVRNVDEPPVAIEMVAALLSEADMSNERLVMLTAYSLCIAAAAMEYRTEGKDKSAFSVN